VYKVRYFPNSFIFESHLGSNSNYVWRNIWKSRQVLMNGCRWRIKAVLKLRWWMNLGWRKKMVCGCHHHRRSSYCCVESAVFFFVVFSFSHCTKKRL
jgi:hypothetical protein